MRSAQGRPGDQSRPIRGCAQAYVGFDGGEFRDEERTGTPGPINAGGSSRLRQLPFQRRLGCHSSPWVGVRLTVFGTGNGRKSRAVRNPSLGSHSIRSCVVSWKSKRSKKWSRFSTKPRWMSEPIELSSSGTIAKSTTVRGLVAIAAALM